MKITMSTFFSWKLSWRRVWRIFYTIFIALLVLCVLGGVIWFVFSYRSISQKLEISERYQDECAVQSSKLVDLYEALLHPTSSAIKK